mmetsp:Transcript_23242/g.54435  ORF Transcript_23242/g.54435 Transcript_23242/m.54435 type:complete len:115 (+) Transcript_23242:114-458(+)
MRTNALPALMLEPRLVPMPLKWSLQNAVGSRAPTRGVDGTHIRETLQLPDESQPWQQWLAAGASQRQRGKLPFVSSQSPKLAPEAQPGRIPAKPLWDHWNQRRCGGLYLLGLRE